MRDILRRNYRNTRQIATAAANNMTAIPNFDDEALRQEYLHAGLPPVLYGAEGSEAQARWIARQIVAAAKRLRLPINAAAVLVSSSSVGEPLAQALSGYGLAQRRLSCAGEHAATIVGRKVKLATSKLNSQDFCQ